MSIYNQCVSDRTIKKDHYHNYWNDAVIYNDDADNQFKFDCDTWSGVWSVDH